MVSTVDIILFIVACESLASAKNHVTYNHSSYVITSNYEATGFSTSAYNAVFSRELFLPLQSTSYQDAILKASKAQDHEDIWMYESLFYGIANGLILESGALDGKTYSTSYFFEKIANWSAIHIEADVTSYQKLLKNRPKSLNVNSALCAHPTIYHYAYDNTQAIHGIIEFMNASFIERWHGAYLGYETNPDLIKDLPKVTCIPLKKILKHFNITHVDIWILDVEGAEEQVLMGTDFHAVHFKAVVMECDGTDVEKDKRKIRILETSGFDCIMVIRNAICKHKTHKPSSREVKIPLYYERHGMHPNFGWPSKS